ncbi:MAG TPA: histidine kinase [Egibacteraceae bacterium]|nr:histidine kinase [Egibacteraceae bacterium]
MAWLATVWLAVTLPLLVLFALSVPAVYARKQTPLPAVRAGLDQLGIPVNWYATWWSVTLLVFATVCVGVATLIVWRRPGETVGWFVALFLVALGTANAPNMEALVWQRPALEPWARAAFQILLACLVLFLFTFPDGRFRPRWSWAVVAVAVVGLATARGSIAEPVTEAQFFALLLGLATGIAVQIHRYRRISTPQQREQARWVTVAMAVAVVTQLAFPLMEGIPAVARPGVGAAIHDMASVAAISAAFALVPLALAVALLRRRLWGLDIVVNRALVYGGVTAVLLVLYVGVATALGRSIGAPGNASGSLLAAALVAVAFAPLRDRIQRGVNRLLYGHRDEPYRVLSDLGQRLEATIAPHAVLHTIVDTVATALKSPYVAIAVHRGDDVDVAVATGTEVDDAVRLPLVHRHEPVGELRVAPRSRDETFNPSDRALLDDLARQAAAAVHAVELTKQLVSSRERLVTAREEERRRLRRDLHDGLGPALASMTLQAETACELVAEDPAMATKILSDLVSQLQASTADIRQLVYDLRPPALDDLGMVDALRSFLARAGSGGLELNLHLPDRMPPLSAAADVAIYRIVQEAVANVLRHAGATSCDVTFSAEGGAVVVDVVDDGVGIAGGVAEGVGLRSMRERAAELGGSCAVTGEPGAGTRVRVSLPRTSPIEVSG